MTQCVAFKCNIWSKKGVSMYRFPKDPKIRRIWIRNLRRNGFKVTEYSKLCARHFTPDQFTTHPALTKRCGYKKLDLRPLCSTSRSRKLRKNRGCLQPSSSQRRSRYSTSNYVGIMHIASS